jgi:PAS domain S-box-containing protein
MRLRTKVFELYPRYYGSLSQLAHAMGMSVSQISRVRSGKRRINEAFLLGALSAFPQFSFSDLFYLGLESDGLVTEEALLESEERYRAIFEQAADSVVLIDAETGSFVEYNDRAHEALGYTRKEFGKLKMADFEVIESAEEVAKHIEKVVKDGADIFETKHRIKGGEIRDIQVSTRAISLGGRCFIQGMWRDITERKRAEEVVRASEERFRTLTERASEGISIVGADGTILYESPSIERILGYRPEDRVGKQSFEALHPDDVSDAAKAYQFITDNPGEIVSMVIRSRHKDGSWHWMECAGRNLLEDAAVHGLVINYRDITQRKLAEEKLRESEEKLRRVFESAADAIAITDLQGVILDINQKGMVMYGVSSKDEILGKHSLELIAPRNHKMAMEIWRKAVKEGAVRDMQYTIVKANGSEVPVEINASVLRDALGKPAGFIGIQRDISGRKLAEEKLRERE